MTTLKLTKILDSSIVIKQEGGHFFIATPNTFIIDKLGLLRLITELVKVGFLNEQDLMAALFRVRLDKENED